jgi:cbb3-type cytochrome oxidase subunit 3
MGAGIAAKANGTIFFSLQAGLAAAFRRSRRRRFDQSPALERDTM